MNNKYSDSVDSVFIDIKNQIVKLLFAEYNAEYLSIILDTLGCKTLDDCQVLLDISSINYVITESVKHYVGRGNQANRKLYHSTTVNVINNSTEKRDLTASMKDYDVTQVFHVDINKTGHLKTRERGIFIPFTADEPLRFTFYKSDVLSANQRQLFSLKETPRKVTLNPFTKRNVTYNIFQYDEFNHYRMDFYIDENSVINHPSVDRWSGQKVIFVKTHLLEFLKAHDRLVPSLKFKNSTGIILRKSSDGKGFSLDNFPAVEKITNFEVETVCSATESIKGPKPTAS